MLVHNLKKMNERFFFQKKLTIIKETELIFSRKGIFNKPRENMKFVKLEFVLQILVLSLNWYKDPRASYANFGFFSILYAEN